MNSFTLHLTAFFQKLEWLVLKNLARRRGVRLVHLTPAGETEIVIENVFETKFSKHALLSYLVGPFVNGPANSHSNQQESIALAEILHEMGFTVDVINWNNTTFIPQKEYAIVIDNHDNLFRLAPYFDTQTLKIFHATNAHWLYQNRVELTRYHEVFLETGKALFPPRQLTRGNSAENADLITMFGNNFTSSTYGSYQKKIHHLPMSVTVTPKETEWRKDPLAGSRFLWLNSHGALLKGLDRVIEAFSELPHCHLTICGHAAFEPGFIELMTSKTRTASNIQFEGWVDISSQRFSKLINTHAWVIGSSLSEGGGGSILNGMAAGLIPLLTPSTSIDLPPGTGFYYGANDTQALVELLTEVGQLSTEELASRSVNSVAFIRNNHTLPAFKEAYRQFLSKAFSKRATQKPLNQHVPRVT